MAQERLPRYDEQISSGLTEQAYEYTKAKPFIHRKQIGHEGLQEAEYSPLQRAVIMRGTKLLNVIITVLLFAVLFGIFYTKNTDRPVIELLNVDFAVSLEALAWLLYALLIVSLGRIYNAYEAGILRISEIVYSQSLANLFGSSIIYVLACLTKQYILNPLPVLAMVFVQGIWSVAWSIAANKLYFRLYPPQKTVIIYKQESDLIKIEQIEHFPSRFDVRKRMMNPEDINTIARELDGCNVAFIVGIDTGLRDKIVNHCIENGIQSYVAPQIGDVVMAGAEHMQMFSTPIMRVHQASPTPEFLFVKRAFDIVCSLISIIIVSPLMLLTALAIKAYDGGPVLYKQIRLTQRRREFSIWKFRSMCVDAEKDGVARLASACDDRITPIGKIIRATRFDELPQLFNILFGDMTIVGPRPERPEIAKQYEQTIPEFALRLQVKAGLTGYAQIYGKYNTAPEEKLQMDLMYINNMSIAEDMRLILATVKILFMKESTHGVRDGQTTAMGGKAEKKREESA